ncbi:MAG: hypothetical protein R3E87_09455 [Burkholderiaceae bacterium]
MTELSPPARDSVAMGRFANPGPAERPTDSRDRTLLLLLVALLLAAWNLGEHLAFDSGDRIGYWLGATGGFMFIALFVYPLRKRIRWLSGLGRLKHWLALHVFFGIGGPVLILLHARFSVGSTNAAVALASMLIVAGSGVIGRYLHVRVNRGLHGEKSELASLVREAGLADRRMRSRLAFAPDLEAELLAHGDRFAPATIDRTSRVWRLFDLTRRSHSLRRRSRLVLRDRLASLSAERGWSAEKTAVHLAQATGFVERYLSSVAQVARLAAYARLFALWHVAHVPFVYLFVLCALFHVLAVHAY